MHWPLSQELAQVSGSLQNASLGSNPSSTGTGAAVARAFASKGFAVALLARTASKLAILEAEITQSGGTAASFPTDLTQPHSLKETFNSIHARFPGSHLKVAVFNLNSEWVVKPFLELQAEEFNQLVHGHLGSAFGFAQLALKEMKKEGGTLIFTGAPSATRGTAGFAAISSACFAARALR
jgi:NAD(P)-dependent dehydrogenase (short-subunit alcohol dehydrogenase family)